MRTGVLGAIVLMVSALGSGCGEGGLFDFEGGRIGERRAADPCPGAKKPFWRDADNDRFGDPAIMVCRNSRPAGYRANDDDCNDADNDIKPGEPEVCDGVDQDCDGVVDDGAPGGETYYADADGDGHGDASSPLESCVDPGAGYVLSSDDCNDADASVNPSTADVCGNELDEDCSGVADDNSDSGSHLTWYRDRDADSFGDSVLAVPVVSCAEPETIGFWATFQGDCNDDNPDIYPDAPEVCNDNGDNDCDGYVDEGTITVYYDYDGDGFGGAEITNNSCVGDDEYPAVAIALGGDCNDGSEFVYPGAEETCNAIDDDCNGLIDSDELVSLAAGTVNYYEDADYDGFGNSSVSFLGCDLRPTESGTGSRWVRDDTDCDDTVATPTGECPPAFMFVMMMAPTLCPETGEPPDLYHQDNDGDGYGNPLVTAEWCEATCDAENGCWALPAAGDDCDDENGDIHPDFAGSGWVDICDNDVDDDCDGYVDENETVDRVFVDIDRDGVGGDELIDNSCEGDAGRPIVTHPTQDDCNDNNAAQAPGSNEVCDGMDNDCNTRADSDDDSLDLIASSTNTPYWTDALDLDGWGYSDPFAVTISLCPMPPQVGFRADGDWAGNNNDCDPENYDLIACGL